MKRSLQSNNSATKEENEGASCSKIGSTHINNRLLDTNNADCNLNLQINSNGPEAQTGLTNETTLELVNDIMDNNSSIEIETKSLNENQKDYISWDDLFMATAFLMAKRSRDPVTQVGACIVSSDHKIVGTGYNEMPTRCCDDSFPLGKDKFDKLNDKRTYICHAELNAVLNTNSISLQKCIIYVSLFPCNECAKIIIQSGIKNVVYCKYKNNNRRHKNENMASEIMFMTSNVNCRSYTPKQNIRLEFKTTREPEKLQINADESETQIVLTNETTLEPVYDIIYNISSIETETKSLNENQKDYISWDDLFMATAFLMAKRSRDPVTQVGACIVSSDHKIVGTGYNEMPTRCCDDSFPLGKDKFDKLNDKRTYICHAELNAVLNTNSISLQKCIIYVSLFPCNECAKIIIQSGIKNVVYCKYKNNNRRHKNENMASEIMFMTSNVNCRSYTPKQNIRLEFKTTREPEKLQINADESETQIVLTNETTLEPVYDIIYNISSIETETKSLNENQKDYISWDDLFMATAFLMAKRSKYHLPEVGACIVSPDNKIVGTGCNGIPTTCSDDNFHEYYKLIDTRMYICHAEMNAVLNKNSISLQKCIIYVSHFPCNECAKIIIQSGIKEVVYCTNEDETEASKKMFKASGVDFRNHTPNQKITITFR